MAIVFIGLGSNEGNRLEILSHAALSLKKNLGMLLQSSFIYETQAWGFESDKPFLNAVIQFETEHSPKEVMNILQYIENQAGRKRQSNDNYSDRPLDLDILYYDHLLSDEVNLQIPHPRIAERNFVLYPLGDIAMDWLDVRTNLSIKTMLNQTKDKSEIAKIAERIF